MTMKELFAPSDMTVGKPWEKIVAFTIPMLIGNIAQQLYNTVDSIVIGKYVGDNALAAVGSASPILNLLLVLFVGISVGVGVMVSQYFGARQRKLKLRKQLRNRRRLQVKLKRLLLNKEYKIVIYGTVGEIKGTHGFL